MAGNHCKIFISADYLCNLELMRHWRAFILACFNALPSALLEGRYSHISYDQHFCPCQSDMVETVKHVLLYCTRNKDSCNLLISPILKHYPGKPDTVLHLFSLIPQTKLQLRLQNSVQQLCTIRKQIIKSLQ